MFKVKTIKEIDYIELDRFLDESDKTQEELRQLLAGFFPNESLDNVRIYYWW